MDEHEALGAWRSVVGEAQIQPLPKVHNELWRVVAEDGREWVLKHLPEWPPGAGPVDEYRVLCFLQAAGIPVATPVVTDAGQIVHNAENLCAGRIEKQPTGTQAYALIPLLPNDPGRSELVGPAHAIGAAIGRLDRALASCPWQISSYLDDPVPDTFGDSYDRLPVELRELVTPYVDRLRTELTDLPVHRTHGDCNEGNVLVHNDEVTGFIDLDHLPIGPRVRDLSRYLAGRLSAHLDDGDADAMAGVLGDYVAGYHSVHQLTDRELAAVVPLMLTLEVGGADWCLNGWVPDPEAYQRNLRTIRWLTDRFDDLVDAARPHMSVSGTPTRPPTADPVRS